MVNALAGRPIRPLWHLSLGAPQCSGDHRRREGRPGCCPRRGRLGSLGRRNGGRADKCTRLESGRPTRPGGSNPSRSAIRALAIPSFAVFAKVLRVARIVPRRRYVPGAFVCESASDERTGGATESRIPCPVSNGRLCADSGRSHSPPESSSVNEIEEAQTALVPGGQELADAQAALVEAIATASIVPTTSMTPASTTTTTLVPPATIERVPAGRGRSRPDRRGDHGVTPLAEATAESPAFVVPRA